jgi:hypothetical protein
MVIPGFYLNIYEIEKFFSKQKNSCGSLTIKFFSLKIIWLNLIGMGVKSVVSVIH